MSNLQVLGTVVTSGTTAATMVQGEPNSATTAEATINMDVDGVTTDEEDSELLIITRRAQQLPQKISLKRPI
jgi:hypothetical protein